jgi:metal-responsive CopG/Arc/MetJ family transcriptional regulator
MPTKHPRVNVVLEEPLLRALQGYAERHGVSLSQAARDLVRESLETHEDLELARIGDERARTFDRRQSLSHAEVWEAAKTSRSGR